MGIDLSRFKVVYGERVLNAISLDSVMFPDGGYPSPENKGTCFIPKFLSVMVINEDGNIVVICDEAWMFQFLPICKKDGA
jgi:hypothetical protein